MNLKINIKLNKASSVLIYSTKVGQTLEIIKNMDQMDIYDISEVQKVCNLYFKII